MLYPMPKKIHFAPSAAKWSVVSAQSVLLLTGLHELRADTAMSDSKLMQNITSIANKAKALDIQIVDLSVDNAMQGMQRLGELLSIYPQLMIAGQVTPLLKQVLAHLMSVTAHICIIDDAILLPNAEQHIQWVDNLTAQSVHHMNTYSLMRLWNLSAPTAYVLSPKGILLAVAEQLNMDALDIDPKADLHSYGLDSVAMVSLVGLWRANGANITYEDFLQQPALSHLMQILVPKN